MPIDSPDRPTGASGPLPALGPTTGAERLTLLDALRGFALAGVLLVNLGSFSLYMYLTPDQRAVLPTAAVDVWLRALVYGLVTGKFITLFSLLFGLGFAVQLERAERRGVAARATYVRRLLVLLAIGVAHGTLLWWGDVLRFYAVLGLALLLVSHASPRALLWSGLLLACVVPALLGPLVQPLLAPLQAALPAPRAMNDAALAAFAGRDWLAVIRVNPQYDLSYLSRSWYEPVMIFSRFLLGFWAGRMLLLHEPERHRALLARICGVGLALGLLGNGVVVLRDMFALTERVPALAGTAGGMLLELLGATGTIAPGAAYAAGFALLFLRPAWRRRLERLAPVGRMALTNYLLQTVVSLLVFYGIGLGVGPRWGMPGRLLFCAALFGAQIAISHWWLARYRFGPAEWLWRTLTYGRRQPMRLAPRPGVVAEVA